MQLKSKAFETWNQGAESLASVEGRIHDSWPIDQLQERGDRRIQDIIDRFPWLRLPDGYRALEVGPGVGYLMEALDRRKPAGKIHGLDVAPAMVAHAKERIIRDRVDKPFQFDIYDGVVFPYPNDTFDFAYSVAVIQHIPKPFAYNIFLEMTRVIKPTGVAVVHLLEGGYLERSPIPLRQEIDAQVKGHNTHWLHFYSRREVEVVMERAIGAPYFHVFRGSETIWAAWVKDRSALLTL